MDTSTPAKSTPQSAKTSGIARISGRLEHARSISTQNGRVVLSLIKLPAPDEFAAPQTVEVQSRTGLGAKGDIVTLEVRVGGAGRSFETTDEQTGHKVRVQTATNRLEVVEV